MARIYRAMMIDGELPQVGGDKKALGTLIGDGPGCDLACDHEGNVHPQQGGMSVAPDVDSLPMHRIPKRLKKKYPTRFPFATASDRMACW